MTLGLWLRISVRLNPCCKDRVNRMKMQIYLTRLSKGWMQASSFASGSKTFKCLLSLTRLSKGWMQASSFAFASKTFKCLLSLTRLSKGWMQASLLCVRLEDFCPEVVNCHKMGREGVLRGALVPSSLLSGRAADVTSGGGGYRSRCSASRTARACPSLPKCRG